MKRRDFIKSIGAAGMFSLLGSISLHSSAHAGEGASRDGLRGPFDVAFDASGDLLITDPSQYRVLRFDSSLKPISSFGSPGSGEGNFNFPMGIVSDSRDQTYVVDSNNCRIQVFSRDGSVQRVIGTVGSIGGSFATPQGICLDGKRILVADTRNHRIQIFDDMRLVGVVGDLGDENDQFRLPTAVAVTPDRDILVLDSKHGLVKVFGEDLKFRRSFGGVGSGPGELNMPQGMKLDHRGRVWVADTGNHRIQEFLPDGTHVSIVGAAGSEQGQFNSPTGIAFREDKIYVADNGNGRIQILGRQEPSRSGLHQGAAAVPRRKI